MKAKIAGIECEVRSAWVLDAENFVAVVVRGGGREDIAKLNQLVQDHPELWPNSEDLKRFRWR